MNHHQLKDSEFKTHQIPLLRKKNQLPKKISLFMKLQDKLTSLSREIAKLQELLPLNNKDKRLHGLLNTKLPPLPLKLEPWLRKTRISLIEKVFTKTTGTDLFHLMLKLLLHQEAKPTSPSNLVSSKLEPSPLNNKKLRLPGMLSTKLPPPPLKPEQWPRDGRTTKREKKFSTTTGTYVKVKFESDSIYII